jgi:tetrapyrrole methylase family protein/MazG family protein
VGQTVGNGRDLGRLVNLVKTLRSDTGCPWDRAQTPEKIKTYLIEEAYEVLDAVESGLGDAICEELGDLLFHIVFLARLFEEMGVFDMGDVIERIVDKMIHRHPHVFGDVQISCVEDVKSQWHEIKAAEPRHRAGKGYSSLETVPAELPILMRAYRLVERASRAGFQSVGINQEMAHIDAEMAMLKDVLDSGEDEKYAEKLGDILFGVVALGRSLGVHPDTALRLAVTKFVTKFEKEEMGKKGHPKQGKKDG